MTLPVKNSGNYVPGLFQREQKNPSGNSLINDQIDPTRPQIQGLTKISGPIVATDNIADMVTNFDPALYDLRPTSHLMRLMAALCGAPGVGGLRKQYATARLSSSVTGANFVDLDAFYGAIFNLSRQLVEQMPTNVDGTTVNPITDVTNSDVWDDVQSRDARYRARIQALARAINMGATPSGLTAAAEAVLSCEVDIVESWIRTDELNNASGILLPTGKSYGQITAQSVTWGKALNTFNVIEGNLFGNQTLPAGNRGELVLTPRRIINNGEQFQLSQVLDQLKPAGTQMTIASLQNQVEVPITVRGYSSDSENWQIQTRVTPPANLIQPTTPVYPNAGSYSVARPAFSDFTGEAWSYAANIVKTSAYQMVNNVISSIHNEESVAFASGVTAIYKASQGVMNTDQALSQRLAGQGIVTNFPYSANRAIANSNSTASGL